jgi:hypothetical protein
MTERFADADSESDESLSTLDEETLARSDSLDVFLVALEQRMLDGHTQKANRVWAAVEHCVHIGAFDQCVELIRSSWAISSKTVADATRERDEICARFLNVYRSAMGKHRYSDAIKALDSIARIRNLDTTPTVNVNVGGQITNASRETVAALLLRAREITESKTMKRLAAIADDQQRVSDGKKILDVGANTPGGGPTPSVPGASAPSNGHGTSGHANGSGVKR